MLIAAEERFPDERAEFDSHHAMIAEQRRDWPEARRRWEAVQVRLPDAWSGYAGHARVLQELGMLDEACGVLVAAAQRFPTDANPWIELAWIAGSRSHWVEAEGCWRLAITRAGSEWWAHTWLAVTIREQGRWHEAEAVLAEAEDRFPNEHSGIAAQYALIAEARRDWTEALRRWEAMLDRFPDEWTGYAGQARALGELKRWNEAEEVLLAAAIRFPSNVGPCHDLARLAESHLRWADAERYWRRFLTLNDREHWTNIALAITLREQNRWREAEVVLIVAGDRFPEEVASFQTNLSMIAEARGDNRDEVLQRWEAVRTRFPDEWAGHAGAARVLRGLGRLHDAEFVIEAALRRLPPVVQLAEQSALNAIELQDWPLAYARLRSAAERFPFSETIRQRFYDVRLRMLDSLSDPELVINPELVVADGDVSVPGGERGEYKLAEIAALFESLGGGVAEEGAWGFGCEFGYFQRYAGTEPISLLRWASIAPTSLVAALESRFAGIDTAADILIHEPTELDWSFTQTRYGIVVNHTGLATASVTRTEAHRRVCRILGFLSKKLIADLGAGEKFFVYRVIGHEIDDELLDRLSRAIGSYGRNKFMFVKKSTVTQKHFTVELVRPGFFIGYIDRFATDARDEDLNFNDPGWEKLCRAALDAAGM